MLTRLLFLKSSLDIVLIGVIILFCISVIFGFFVRRKHNKLMYEVNCARDYLRKSGEKIPIKYSELEIKTHFWIQEAEYDPEIQTSSKEVNVKLNIIILEKKHRGHHFKEEY